MTSFVYSPESLRGETLFLDFIPDMYLAAGGAQSSFISSVAAVSRLNYMNRYRAGALASWVTSSYAQALAATNRALSVPQTAYEDATLAAVWLLSMFELLISTKEPHGQPRTSTWSQHNTGAVALLLSRGAEQLKTARGLQLFRLVHTSAVISMMLDGRVPPGRLLEMIDTHLEDEACIGRVELLLSKQLHLLAEVRASVLGGDDGPPPFAPGEQTDFERATASNPAWQVREVDAALQDRTEYERHYFSSGFVMSNWLTHWASMLVFHQIALARLARTDQTRPLEEATGHELAEHRARLLKEIEANAVCIIGAAAFAFGELDSSGCRTAASTAGAAAKEAAAKEAAEGAGPLSAVGAVHILWPLGVVLASPCIGEGRKGVARRALRKVGEVFRVTTALNYV
jgi:hypothetical protein